MQSTVCSHNESDHNRKRHIIQNKLQRKFLNIFFVPKNVNNPSLCHVSSTPDLRLYSQCFRKVFTRHSWQVHNKMTKG